MHQERVISGQSQSGQSLLESALVLPFLLVVLFNSVNIGYYFAIALNLSTSPRQGAEYSIQGFASDAQISLPSADSVHALVNEGITGSMAAAANSPIQVCTFQLGVSGSGTGQISKCVQYSGHPAIAPDADPEAPNFVLNRVDIEYQAVPLVPGILFNLIPAPRIRRYVEMRAME